MIHILLADDHTIIRTGLKLFVSKHIPHSSIDEAWDGDSAFALVKEKEYQMIILDVNMPDTDSFGLVGNILAYRPAANILMFSMNAEEVYAKKYLLLGAKGYLSKSSSESEIIKALDSVLAGKRFMSAELSQHLSEDALGKKAINPFDDLSGREFEIVLHLLRGSSSADISKSLNLQSSTIGTYKARIFSKLHCRNILEISELAKVYNIK